MRGGGWIVSQLPLVAQHPDVTLQAAGLLSFEGRPMSTQPHVIIVGGGFGGLSTARALRKAPVRVTLVDRRNFHLFQPLLYQVATGQLSPANIAAPLRAVVSKQKNTHVLLADVVGIDASTRRILLSDGTLDYDLLILATGARHHYFGKPQFNRYRVSANTSRT